VTKNTFFFLLATGVILRIFFSFQIPEFAGNDELAHLRYAQHIAAEKKPPNLNNYPKEDPAGNEYFQPPLYYLLLAPLIAISSNPSNQLHLARIVSIIIWSLGFYFAIKLISIIKLREPHGTVALAFLALLPTYIANSATVNNDTLTISLTLLTLFYIAELLNKKLTPAKIFGLSALTSLTILSKITGLILLPAVIWLIYYKLKRYPKQVITHTLIFIASIVLLTNWWFLYNFLTYQNFLGPITASTATFTNVPFDIYKLYLIARGTFFTFWASYGPANQIRLPMYIYLLLLLPTVLSILGFFLLLYKDFRKRIKFPIQSKYIYTFLIVLFANIFLLLIFNLRWHQPLGRYLYPSLFEVALFWSIGLNTFLPKTIQKHMSKLVITMMLILNLLGAVAIINYYKL